MTQVKRCNGWSSASFSNPYIASPTSQLILQPFRRLPTSNSFYSPSVASPTSQAFHRRHSSFSNPSAASSTPQLILQTFRRFTYVTGHSTTLPLLHLRHRHFTYFTWRAAHAYEDEKTVCGGLACYSKLLSLEVATVLDRTLLEAVNLVSFSLIASSDSSFNTHNALYFVKYPPRATG